MSDAEHLFPFLFLDFSSLCRNNKTLSGHVFVSILVQQNHTNNLGRKSFLGLNQGPTHLPHPLLVVCDLARLFALVLGGASASRRPAAFAGGRSNCWGPDRRELAAAAEGTGAGPTGDIAADEVDDRVKDFLPLHRPANPHGWWDNVVLLADGSGGIHPGERGPQLPAECGLIPFGWP